MARNLTESEIKDILSFIKPSSDIPKDAAIIIANNARNKFRQQLINVKIHKIIIPRLKEELKKVYENSLIDAGESVGIICSQSIGEKNTQTTLNSFHKAGLAEKTMTTGVPRLKEILNATHEPKLVNHRIFFKNNNSSIQELRNSVGSNFVNLTIKDLCEDISVHLEKNDETWYDAFEILHNNDFRMCKGRCISLKLKRDKLFTYKLSLEYISKKIEETFADYKCVYSPITHSIIDVFINVNNISLPEDRIFFVTHENTVEICLEEVVQKSIEEFHICGIKGIEEAFYEKVDNKWIIETCGKFCKKADTFLDILAQPNVDSYNTISNNIWSVLNVLGIEATRQYMIEEFAVIMDGINLCHPTLLADRMTFSGSIESISRYTMRSESEVLLRASFEESMDNFLNAAFFAEEEQVKGLAASLICGKSGTFGTGFFSVRMNLDELPEEDTEQSETSIEIQEPEVNENSWSAY